jgi:anthranilate phosphoribosyltransferase
MHDLPALLRPIVEERASLSRDQAHALLAGVLRAAEEHLLTPHVEAGLAALLTALALRGETAEELAGFVDAMRAAATPLPLAPEERATLVDTCGTGGDALGTFNISTGAALVAAAAGARVAKHGNRAVTSRTGSADVLAALGVPVELTPNEAARCLRETGFVFLLAPTFHPALRHLAPLRRALPFRTIFHLAGPLSNPAGAPAQVMGVWDPARIATVAGAMQLLGVQRAFVVHGEGMDEWTTTGATHFVRVEASRAEVQSAPEALFPEQLHLHRATLASLGGGDSPEASAGVLQAIFAGEERGPRRDIVLLNAAAALVVAELAPTLADGIALAGQAIDGGEAARLLQKLREFRGDLPRQRGV